MALNTGEFKLSIRRCTWNFSSSTTRIKSLSPQGSEKQWFTFSLPCSTWTVQSKENSELIRSTHLTTVYVDYYRCEQLAQYKSVHPISFEHCTEEKHRLPIYIYMYGSPYMWTSREFCQCYYIYIYINADKALLRSTYTVSALEVKLKSRGNFLTLLAACNMILRHRNSVHEITLIFLAKTNQNHDIFSLESSSRHVL